MKPIKDCLEFIGMLETSIRQKDKKQILSLYDANDVDWDITPTHIQEKYDLLVEQANEILDI